MLSYSLHLIMTLCFHGQILGENPSAEAALNNTTLKDRRITEPSQLYLKKLHSEFFSASQSIAGPIRVLQGERGGATVRVWL